MHFLDNDPKTNPTFPPPHRTPPPGLRHWTPDAFRLRTLVGTRSAKTDFEQKTYHIFLNNKKSLFKRFKTTFFFLKIVWKISKLIFVFKSDEKYFEKKLLQKMLLLFFEHLKKKFPLWIIFDLQGWIEKIYGVANILMSKYYK